jgi:flagellar hook protein FlgE
MGSFSTPLSGLTAAQKQLQAVSNNLANIDTDGYKDGTLTFSDVFSQVGSTNGSGDPIQVGSGVSVASMDSNFTDGTVSSTGTASNMALSGNGFFVTKGSSGVQEYTRAGDFTTNKSGQLVTPNGDLVQGYPAVDGVVNTSASLQALQVSNLTTPAVASTTVGITANITSGTAIGDAATSSTAPIYDSLGTEHTLSVSYTKTAANTWTYTVTIPTADLPAPAVPPAITPVNTTVATGTMTFDSNGALTGPVETPATATTPAVLGVSPITIAAFADGASAMTLNWNMSDAAGNPTITQNSSASSTTATSTDGLPSGTLSSYAVDSDGTVEGTFSNGKTLALGQIAVASFANNQGLASVGNNSYEPSNASGSAVIGVAGAGGRGTITGGSLEASNVDIATEFSKLIVAQQAYSANAKAVTTFSTISQATLQMIQ